MINPINRFPTNARGGYKMSTTTISVGKPRRGNITSAINQPTSAIIPYTVWYEIGTLGTVRNNIVHSPLKMVNTHR